MRALAVALAACSAPAVAPPKPAAPVEPTGPELVVNVPGATAFAIDGEVLFWLTPAGSGESGVWRMELGKPSVKLDDAAADVHGLAIDRNTDPPNVVWISSHGGLSASSEDGRVPGLMVGGRGSAATIASGSGRFDTAQLRDDGWHVQNFYDEYPDPAPLDGDDLVLAEGSDVVIGTSTTLYQGHKLATPVDGGVRALAVDGDDVFFGNTSIFEKLGRGPVNKLGPAGGPVTAMAVDRVYLYWAIAAGDRDPAIYRARRSKPELELLTRVGSATQLIVAGDYLYWLDPGEGAIHRIKRQK
jgi:hypothetical protein